MAKIAGSGSESGSESGSGSISQKHGSEDSDPPQNVMDPEHCAQECENERYALLLTWCAKKEVRTLNSAITGAHCANLG
jgi:hypothetical protein